MIRILLCTNLHTILEHWRESVTQVYGNVININSERGLTKCLDTYSNVFLILDSNFFTNQKDYIRSILEAYPKTRILYLDDNPTFKIGKELLALGIKGYGNSRLSSINLIQAIEVIKSNNIWLYPEFVQQLIKESIHKESNPNEDKLNILTCKEREVANFVANGYSNKIIAQKCNVSESTVKVHLHSIFNKLEITDRLSLALMFR